MHIALVISQPVVVGAWCTFCLRAAAIMLPMIPLKSMRWGRSGSTSRSRSGAATPGLFDITGTAADIQHLGGALVVTVAVIAMGQPVRALRFLTCRSASRSRPVLIASSTGTRLTLAAGLAIAALALPRGPQREHYGSRDWRIV